MPRTHKKQFVEESVYDAALARFRTLFERYDKVVVSFSGGKDSTVCLNLALEEARRVGKLPLDVYFWDEEAIHPETVEYVERVRQRDDVRLKWLCLPVKHRNACSRQEPYWFTWDPDARAKWVRPLPEGAVTSMRGFRKGLTIPEAATLVYGPEEGMIADVRGLRADESLRRYQAVSVRLKDNWIGNPRGHSAPCSPIYDWTSIDVWTAPRLYGWDYNQTYDLMTMLGVPLNVQRVCPPFGEEPLANLYIYAQLWPSLWHRMIRRVHGAATAARYSRTELYGFGARSKPADVSWKEWTKRMLALYPAKYRAIVARNLDEMIARHQTKTRRPIPEEDADPMTGLSWRFIANAATRGDFKGRIKQRATSLATNERTKRGISLEESEDRDADGSRY